MTTVAANPYQAPEGNLVKEGEEGVGSVRFFHPSCRIGRMRYLAHSFLATLAFYVVFFALLFALGSSESGGALMAAMALLYIPFVAMFWIIMIQRLHDLNKSGFYSLLMLVPLVNIVMGLYMLFGRGTDGANQYGNRPPPNQVWHWVLGLFMPVVAILGIVAAVALPAYQGYTERAQSVEMGGWE